jgi:hypothetical protein
VTLTATFVSGIHKDGTPPYILYWDSTTETMQVGAWTTQGGNANTANQLFFQFGSVVGMTNTVTADGTAWQGMSTVKFNPTNTSSFTWTTIPNWNGTDTTDGYISSSSYHTLTNVQAGRGDPCKLVGLTVEQIQAGIYDNGLYGMPTNADNQAGYAISGTQPSSNTTNTSYGVMIDSDASTFLPASGRRNFADGATYSVGIYGFYLSSRACDSTGGYRMDWNTSVSSSTTNSARSGLAVRCVPQ